MDAETYRQLQIDAVTGHEGTSEGEIVKVTSWLVMATLTWRLLNLRPGRMSSFLVEFTLLIFPQIILFCYPQWTRWLIVSTILPSLLLVATSPKKGNESSLAPPIRPSHVAFLTNTRAAIMIMCVIGILAVDFPSVFPRRFAKTETVGTSLMDAGVGCVVVSYGLTAARYYWRSVVVVRKERGTKSPSMSLWTTMKSTVPLLVLGIARMLAVKVLGYQEHISEYGVHWNFFMTLGCLPLALWLLLGMCQMPPTWSFPAGYLLGVAYETILQRTGLAAWIFSGISLETGLPFWFVANKEGLISLVGYTSLCLMSLGVGVDLMTEERIGGTSWSVLKRMIGKLGMLLVSYWLCTRWLGLSPSRRLMNLSFATGSLILTMIQMLGFLLLDLLLPPRSDSDRVPMIATGVSSNQLAFFLLANLLTGVINLTSYTLLQPAGISLAIISIYMLILCCTAVYWHLSDIRLRL